MLRIYAGICLCVLVMPVLASNFGDLPRVLPFFWLALFGSCLFAVSKASQADAQTGKRHFDVVIFLLWLLLGAFLSGVLLAVLWVLSF